MKTLHVFTMIAAACVAAFAFTSDEFYSGYGALGLAAVTAFSALYIAMHLVLLLRKNPMTRIEKTGAICGALSYVPVLIGFLMLSGSGEVSEEFGLAVIAVTGGVAFILFVIDLVASFAALAKGR